jgi:hypothetical protein
MKPFGAPIEKMPCLADTIAYCHGGESLFLHCRSILSQFLGKPKSPLRNNKPSVKL